MVPQEVHNGHHNRSDWGAAVLKQGVFTFDTITDLIGEQQYGCLPGKSTSMALADLLHNWITSLETPGKAIRILMVDYRKAFDRVDHNLVTEKLESMGVAPFLVSWTRSFLHERQNQVKIESTYSNAP